MGLINSLALTSLSGLPPSIQFRIFYDTSFQKDCGINGANAPFNDAGRIRLGDLLDAVRQVYDTKSPYTVQNLSGDEVLLELHNDRVVIVRVGDEVREEKTTPFELALLSPEANIRLDAFDVLSRQFKVTGPRPSKWCPIIKQRPLSNDDIYQIYDEIGQSVPNWWSIIQEKISSAQLVPEDLVPLNAAYFTTLCGPFPNGMDVNEYILGPFADHRKMLGSQNLQDGMALLLLGSLHKDASVVHALSDYNDDEVFDVGSRLKDLSDPFTLIGIIEIALSRRATKPEFEGLASELIEKLCGETLPRLDGMDVYDFFPQFVDLALRHLRHIDGMMKQPPYWHRLCAFTHAGLLTRLFDGLTFEPEKMTQWFESSRRRSDGLADILALRCEPSWRYDDLTREQIQAEIIGRLNILALKEKAEGRELPNDELLNRRVEECRGRGTSPFRPGPLEGCLRPKDRQDERMLSADQLEPLLTKLNETPSEFPWGGLDKGSAEFYLPDDFRASLSEKLKMIDLPEGEFSKRTNLLATASLIASVHQDENMIEAIVERTFQEFEGQDDTQSMFLILLMASTAFGEDEWLDWFIKKLHRLAVIAPMGEPMKILSILIEELKSLLPIPQWRFGQIEALCSCAKMV